MAIEDDNLISLADYIQSPAFVAVQTAIQRYVDAPLPAKSPLLGLVNNYLSVSPILIDFANAVPRPAGPITATNPTLIQLCSQVDAERDRRSALDFSYDFGALDAIADDGTKTPAGVRALQAESEDITRWMATYSLALTKVVQGQPTAIIPIRTQDNANIQTAATDVLAALAALFTRNAGLLFYGATLKAHIKAAGSIAAAQALYDGATWPS